MNLSYAMGRAFFKSVFALYFRWEIRGAKNVPSKGPAILASNHCSYLDPPLVGAALSRDIHFLARETLFGFPLGPLLRSWNAVPVDRDGGGGKGLRVILNRLKLGEAIILFPEGTRSPDGRLGQVRSGIGMAAVKSSAPIIPVRVFGTFEAYGRHMKFPLPRKVAVCFGEPLNLQPLREEATECSTVRLKEIYKEIADAIQQAIARMKPEPQWGMKPAG